MATKVPRQAAKRNWKTFSGAEDSDSNTETVKKIRQCSRSGCPASAPICFVQATNVCCGNGYTSRWYHVSAGEHFCNECFEFFYRSTKGGYDQYTAWKRLWSHNGNVDNSVRNFMSDQMLPYWAQCNLCRKWRQIYRETDLNPTFLKKYVCTKVIKNQSQEKACSVAEDFRVEDLVKDLYLWSKLLQAPLFARNAVYGPCIRKYYPDTVGISPSDTSIHKYPEGVTEIRPYLHPFQDSDSIVSAMTLPPHDLTEDEQMFFPSFLATFRTPYLIIRNTAIALWNINVKKYLTRDRCMNHICVRGLSRIWISEHVDNILFFLTMKGFINCGLVQLPTKNSFIPQIEDDKKIVHPVIIVGGGLSGLAAAHHLKHLGIEVKVLEASNHVGGRAVNVDMPFSRGASMIVGSYNNPLVIICKQLDLKMQEINEHCVLLDEEGHVIDDRRMQFHFEAMLDINKHKCREQTEDISLLDRFSELHAEFKEESGIKFSKLEESLLQFHLSNLEFACGSSLCNISAQLWDQNEEYPQFSGPPIFIQENFNKITDKLAADQDVIKNAKVCEVDYGGHDIRVECTSGESYTASKVLITVPLSVLKDNEIKFSPTLPENKEIMLACGFVEKVMLEFPERFWADVIKEFCMFGRVPSNPSVRGMFDVFYDLSQPNETKYILVSYLTGDAVRDLGEKSDEELVEVCVGLLRKLFKDKTVPSPSHHFVTRWKKTENIHMSYSYIPTGASAQSFDNMERDVDQKVFFAGEATHKQFHQTLTGAYMSGIREAEKIYQALTQ